MEYLDEMHEFFKFPKELADSSTWIKPKYGYSQAWNYWAKQNPSYIFYSGHGNYNGWGAPAIYTQIMDNNKALRSIKNPVMLFSITCRTGGYDKENCFVKYWIDESGGALGAFAMSDLSYIDYQNVQVEVMMNCIWPKSRIIPFYGDLLKNRKIFYSGDTTKLVKDYVVKMDSIYANLYPDGMRMGEVLDESVSSFNPYFDEAEYSGPAYQRNVAHYFGDPTMQWLIEAPKFMPPGPYYNLKNNNKVSISFASNVSSLTVFITNTNEMYTIHNTKEVEIPIEDISHAVVVAHGYGYRPVIWAGPEVNLRALD